MSAPALAEVTYLGDKGVSARIFFSHPDNAGVDHCTACHDSGLGSGSRSGAPLGVNYDTYAAAISGSNDTLGNSYVQSGFMPYVQADLSTALMSLMQGWIDDGSLERAPPTLSTSSAASIGKYSATLRGHAKENGDNASIDFEYDNDSDLDSGASNSTNVNVPGNGGGGEESSSFLTRSISGLACGTQYWFRTRASTSHYGFTVAADVSTFTTDACNVGPAINWMPPDSIEEGQLFNEQVTVSDPDDTVTGLDFSLANNPPGMTIDGSGFISWTPGNGDTSTGNVTVTVEDGGEDGAIADDYVFNIPVNAVNDPPQITSMAPTVAFETVEYQYNVAVDDPDDVASGLSF